MKNEIANFNIEYIDTALRILRDCVTGSQIGFCKNQLTNQEKEDIAQMIHDMANLVERSNKIRENIISEEENHKEERSRFYSISRIWKLSIIEKISKF